MPSFEERVEGNQRYLKEQCEQLRKDIQSLKIIVLQSDKDALFSSLESIANASTEAFMMLEEAATSIRSLRSKLSNAAKSLTSASDAVTSVPGKKGKEAAEAAIDSAQDSIEVAESEAGDALERVDDSAAIAEAMRDGAS